MAKKFSLFSWNIKMFTLEKTDKARVIQHIQKFNPDIFGLLEVVGSGIWEYLFEAFPNHNFFLTEGEETQEILIGVHKKLQVFLTQRDEFKTGRTSLRPGSLLSFKLGDEVYTVLYLHLKSLTDPEGFGLRDAMLQHAFNLKGALDKAAGGSGKANFILIGDFNTMGMNYYRDDDVSAEVEIKRISYSASRRKMSILPKNSSSTWTNGNGTYSNLDHVIASRHINFKTWEDAQVKVDGWNQFAPDSDEFKTFIDTVSDHCAIYCEVIS